MHICKFLTISAHKCSLSFHGIPFPALVVHASAACVIWWMHVRKQAARRAEKGEKRGKRAAEGGGQPLPLRQRDRMLSHVRAFQRLRPEDRHALLTEKVSCHAHEHQNTW